MLPTVKDIAGSASLNEITLELGYPIQSAGLHFGYESCYFSSASADTQPWHTLSMKAHGMDGQHNKGSRAWLNGIDQDSSQQCSLGK